MQTVFKSAVLTIICTMVLLSAAACGAKTNLVLVSEEETHFYYEFTAGDEYEYISGVYVYVKDREEYPPLSAHTAYDGITSIKGDSFPALKKGDKIGIKISKWFIVTDNNVRENLYIEREDILKISIIGKNGDTEIYYQKEF